MEKILENQSELEAIRIAKEYGGKLLRLEQDEAAARGYIGFEEQESRTSIRKAKGFDYNDVCRFLKLVEKHLQVLHDQRHFFEENSVEGRVRIERDWLDGIEDLAEIFEEKNARLKVRHRHRIMRQQLEAQEMRAMEVEDKSSQQRERKAAEKILAEERRAAAEEAAELAALLAEFKAEQTAERSASVNTESAKRTALEDLQSAGWAALERRFLHFAEDYLPSLAAKKKLENAESEARRDIEADWNTLAQTEAFTDILLDIETLTLEEAAAREFEAEGEGDAWLSGESSSFDELLNTEHLITNNTPTPTPTLSEAPPGPPLDTPTYQEPQQQHSPEPLEHSINPADTASSIPNGGETEEANVVPSPRDGGGGGAGGGEEDGAAPISPSRRATRKVRGGVDMPSEESAVVSPNISGVAMSQARGGRRAVSKSSPPPPEVPNGKSAPESEERLDLGTTGLWVQGNDHVHMFPAAVIDLKGKYPSLSFFSLTAHFVANASPTDVIRLEVADDGDAMEGQPTSESSVVTHQEDGIYSIDGKFLGRLSFDPEEGLLTYTFSSTNGHVLNADHLQNLLCHLVYSNTDTTTAVAPYKLLRLTMAYRGTPKPVVAKKGKKKEKEREAPRTVTVERRVKFATLPPLLQRHRKLKGPVCIDRVVRSPGLLLKGVLSHPMLQYPDVNGGRPYVKVSLEFVNPQGHEDAISKDINVFSLGSESETCDVKDIMYMRSRFCSLASKQPKVMVNGDSGTITEGSLSEHCPSLELLFKSPRPGTVGKFIESLHYKRKEEVPGNTYIRVIRATVSILNEYQQDVGHTSVLIVLDLLGASRGSVLHVPSIASAYRLPHAGVSDLFRAFTYTPRLVLYPDAILCTDHRKVLTGGTITVEGFRRCDDVSILSAQHEEFCEENTQKPLWTSMLLADPELTRARYNSEDIFGDDSPEVLQAVQDVLATLRMRAEALRLQHTKAKQAKRPSIATADMLKEKERSDDKPEGQRGSIFCIPDEPQEGAAEPDNPEQDVFNAQPLAAHEHIPISEGRSLSVSSAGALESIHKIYHRGTLCAVEMTCARRLYIGLLPDACTAALAQHIVRHLVFSCEGSKLWKKTRGRREIILSIDLGTAPLKEPLTAATSLRVSSPMLNSTSSLGNNVSKTYREQADVIQLGPFDLIEQSADELCTGAFVELEIVSGKEDSDQFSLRGCEVSQGAFQLQGVELGHLTSRPGYLRVDFACSNRDTAHTGILPLVPSTPGEAVSRGGVAFLPHLQSYVMVNPAVNKREKCTTGGWIVRMNPHLASVLKAFSYKNCSQNPQSLNKLISMRVYDGGRGMVMGVVEVDVVPVYDVTELNVDTTELVYRQSGGRSEGFSILRNATLVDPDTHDFRKGRVSVELVCGGDGNDKLDFVTLEQQNMRAQRSRRHDKIDIKPKSANKKTKKPKMKKAPKEDKDETDENAEADKANDPDEQEDDEDASKPWYKVSQDYLLAMGTTVDDAYAETQFAEGNELWLVITGNVLLVNSIPIATVAFKGSGVKGSHPVSLALTFACSFVLPLHVVSYVLRCICYESNSAKLITNQRMYQVKLNACDAPVADTRLRIQLTVNVQTIWAPSYSSSFKYRENSGAKPINAQIKYTIPTDIATGAAPNASTHRITQGHVVVTLQESVDVNDVLCIVSPIDGFVWTIVTQAVEGKRRSTVRRSSNRDGDDSRTVETREVLYLQFPGASGDRRPSAADGMAKGDEMAVGVVEWNGKGEMKVVFSERYAFNVRVLTLLLHSLSFKNDSDDPTPGARSVDIRLFEDRDDQFGCAVSTIIDVYATDDVTEINLQSDRLSYVLGSDTTSQLFIAQDASVIDPDTHIFSGPEGFLQVSFLSGSSKSDVLSLESNHPGLQILEDGSVTWQDEVVCTMSRRYGGLGKGKFKVLFKKAPLEAVQELVRSVVFSNASKRDSACCRCVGIHVKDGKASQTSRVNINVELFEAFVELTADGKSPVTTPLSAVRITLPTLQEVTLWLSAQAHSAEAVAGECSEETKCSWPETATVTVPWASFCQVSENVMRVRKQVVGECEQTPDSFQVFFLLFFCLGLSKSD